MENKKSNGKTIPIDPELHSVFKQIAAKRGVSMKSVVEQLIQHWIDHGVFEMVEILRPMLTTEGDKDE